MSERSQVVARTAAGHRSLLIVANVSSTMDFLVPFARHFRQRGWRVDGAARELSTAGAASAFDAVYDVPLSRSIQDVRQLTASAASLASLLEHGYDIVHVHTPIAAFITRMIARRMPAGSRPKIVYTAHGFHFHRDGRRLTNAVFLTAERVAGRWTDRLVVINEEDYEAARRRSLVPARRLCYMRGIGVDTDWYTPGGVTREASRSALGDVGMDPDRPFFVTVGWLDRNKRPTDVVRALAKMRDSEPALLFVGDGRERTRVRRVASDLGVADRVVMSTSWIPDVRPLVAPAIALIQASKREGLPRSIMEALSLEVPVIASAARGSRELVGTDGGHLVPIGATADMAAAMDRLAEDPQGRLAMGRRGRRRMVETYDMNLIIEDHERLYAGLLAETSMPRRGEPTNDT